MVRSTGSCGRETAYEQVLVWCPTCSRREGSSEKLVDDLRELPRTRPHSQVSIVEDVELRMWDQAMHDLRVDYWNKRIVISMQNQCWLPEFAQPGDAGPTHYSQHLIEVAEHTAQVGCACELLC